MAPYSLQQFQPGAKQLKKFIKYWPELTVNQVTKYPSISEATVKVYMHAQQSNIRSNQKNPLLTKIWTLTYQSPIAFIAFPKMNNHMMIYPVITQ